MMDLYATTDYTPKTCEHDWSMWRVIVFSIGEIFEWRACHECRIVEWRI